MSVDDPFRFKLTDEQRRIVATVRDLTQSEFKPRGLQYMNGAFPWENIASLAKVGVLGMAVPQGYGGAEFGVFDTALVLEEIAKGCYVTAMAVLGEVGVQTRIIATYAPEAIKRRLLPAVCTGDCILAICMTEPQAGTDVASYTTNTTVRGNTLRLKGVKTLVSRAEEAGAFVVFTRINGQPGRDGIGCVLVEKGTPGLVLAGKFHTMGGEYLQEVRFEDCELPAENLLLSEGGFKRLLSAFNTQRCLNPSISLGLAEGAFDEALRYARDRSAFGRAIGEFQGMRWKLADMYTDIEAGRGLLYRACATADPFPDPLLAATAKVYCNEMSVRVTSDALQVFGGYGFTDEYLVSRLYRGARYGSLGGGTSETLRDLIGKRLMEAMSRTGYSGCPISKVDEVCMDDETTLRRKTATLTRMLNLQGTIGMFGHVSVRVPGTNRVLLSPGGGTDKSTVQPDEIFVFDIDGNIVHHPGGLIPLEWRIHTRIHRDRPECMCIAHLHARHGTVLGIAGHDVVPVFLHGSFLHGGVPTWNNPRLVVNDDQAADLSRALGDKIAVQMRGHGSVVVGESAEAAFFGCTFLEENASKQLEAEIMGGAIALSADEARDCSESTYNPRLFKLLWTYYESKVALSAAPSG